MTAHDWVTCIFLCVGVIGFLLTSIGLLAARDVYEQIHYLSPGSLIGAVFIPLALLVHDGFSQAASKGIVIAILLFAANPVLSHATARAARIRRQQQVSAREEEHFPIAEESK
jgi:monovalent cation/proton antiporter MnhG/PhaG subunit